MRRADGGAGSATEGMLLIREGLKQEQAQRPKRASWSTLDLEGVSRLGLRTPAYPWKLKFDSYSLGHKQLKISPILTLQESADSPRHDKQDEYKNVGERVHVKLQEEVPRVRTGRGPFFRSGPGPSNLAVPTMCISLPGQVPCWTFPLVYFFPHLDSASPRAARPDNPTLTTFKAPRQPR